MGKKCVSEKVVLHHSSIVGGGDQMKPKARGILESKKETRKSLNQQQQQSC